MKFEMSGFDELNKKLKDMEKAAKELDGENEVSFGELFNNSFMKKYTNSENVQVFFDNSGFKTDTDEEFEAIDQAELDSYVQSNSKFNTWEEMKGKAGEEYVVKKLGF